MLKQPMRSGHILTFSLLLMSVLLILITVVFQLIHHERFLSNKSYRSKQALNLAESGIEHAVRQLNINPNYVGEANRALGQGTFTVTVTGTGKTRVIESSGKVDPALTRKVKVEAQLDADNVEFFYGLQVDEGGLTMGNNSSIIGNTYSNGSIVAQSGATITGDVIVAGGLNPDPSTEWTTHTDNQFFATANNNRDIAQSFITPVGGKINKVSVFLGKVGNPTSNLTVQISTDDGGKPSTSGIATSIIPFSSVGLTPSWIDATFLSAPDLVLNSKYWITLDYNSSSSVNHWNWRKDPSDSFANNTGKYASNCCSGNPTWTDAGGDLAFKVWIGGTVNSISGLTVGSSTSGTGWANQFNNTNIHGSSCPNQYCIVDNPPQQSLPISDGVIQDWKDVSMQGGVNQGDYFLDIGQSGSLGPKKVEGNLILSNSATLSVTGSLWVTGNINVSNGASIILDPGYGSSSGIIVSDGIINVANGATFQGTGNGSYVLMLTSRDAKTEVSINVQNNSVGVIYYAGKSIISFANNASAKEATAWGINLDNNAVVTYESGLSNIYFSSGPGAGWKVKRGTWLDVSGT